ncbi:MAG: 1-acyl-sn-glycerol-3-phosphate acyltransferase [Proteobacteria bacterium]|nr:1-acyl-sn-glycerol-3-phosphate acyltransferase [Pseudomonadota bacterium]
MNLRTFLIFAWTLPWSAIGIISMILDPTGHLFSFLSSRYWARQMLWIGGVKVTVKGGESVDWKRPYIICVNHQSQVDIPLLFAHLPTNIRFLAKRALFYIPIFGWMLAIARFVPVDRSGKDKARQAILRAAVRIKKGPSLLVFPEGTRTPDGEVHEFKSGAFIMAIHASIPILPLAIRGTYNIVPKNRLDTHPGNVEIIIGEPVETEGFVIEDKTALIKQVRDTVVAMHKSGNPPGSP